jgi:hypothetical protein
MKWILAIACALAVPALAQEKPPGAAVDNLPALRAAFVAMPVDGPAAVIACLPDRDPLILMAGTDAAGKKLTPQTLLPLLSLAKVLAADAIQCQLKDKTGQGSGHKIGDRELTVRELLDGTALLPDYFVLDGGEGTADAAELRSCAALAAGAKLQLRTSSLGASEFVLLEPLAFADHYQDWPSMLRSVLAPRAGVDPRSADVALRDPRASVAIAAEEMAKLAAARPALLRTMLSAQDLATWMQWRLREEMPLWSSARMGHAMPTPAQPGEQRWSVDASALNQDVVVSQYPARKAGFVWVGPRSKSNGGYSQVRRAFEADLFNGAPADAAKPVPGAAPALPGGALAAGPRGAAGNALAATRWRSAPQADGSSALQLAFPGNAKERLTVTLGSLSLKFATLARTGDAFTASAPGRGAMYSVWIWPQPDADQATKLAAVLVTLRMSGAAITNAAGAAGAAVPQYFELVSEKN